VCFVRSNPGHLDGLDAERRPTTLQDVGFV